MRDDELKPCPFCGGDGEIKSGGAGNNFVQCATCHASGDDGGQQYAIRRWNTRLSSPSVSVSDEEVERIALQLFIAEEMGQSTLDLATQTWGKLSGLRTKYLRLTRIVLAFAPVRTDRNGVLEEAAKLIDAMAEQPEYDESMAQEYAHGVAEKLRALKSPTPTMESEDG